VRIAARFRERRVFLVIFVGSEERLGPRDIVVSFVLSLFAVTSVFRRVSLRLRPRKKRFRRRDVGGRVRLDVAAVPVLRLKRILHGRVHVHLHG